jgi:hypothetical protein
MEPVVTRLVWPRAHRIISTRHPPIDLFEDIADPAKWDAIASGETKSNARVIASLGRLELVPPERRVGGPGASYVMAPFVYVSPHWAGRFHDGSFGAYYAANRFETAVAETSFHRARFYRDTEERPGWFSQFRELIGAVDADIHDLRGDERFAKCLDPDSYEASQALARALRAAGANGLVYPSVRDGEGECVAAFWPDVVAIPKFERAIAYHFGGERIDLVRDEASKEVWRII